MASTSGGERVALAERAWDAYNADDVETVLTHFDPEIEESRLHASPTAKPRSRRAMPRSEPGPSAPQ